MFPTFAIWHVTGHGYPWQASQLAQGFPIEPSIKLPTLSEANKQKSVTNQIDAFASSLRQFDGRDICIRFDNITTEIERTFPRIVPLTEDNWRDSVLCVRRKIDGTLDQTPVPDPLGPVEMWRECGRRFADSLWMRQVQVHIPNPRSVIFRENNEGARRRFKFLGTEQGEWLPREVIESQSMREAEWVEERRNIPMAACMGEWFDEENARYHDFYSGFENALTPAWQGKLRYVGYGREDENYQNHAMSPALYLGDDVLTNPQIASRLDMDFSQWDWAEWSISLKAPLIYLGAMRGVTAIVDPESWAGFITHAMWRMRRHNSEVRLVHFAKHTATPYQSLFTEADDIAAAHAMGRPDLLSLVLWQYELPVMREQARIRDHGTISRYWQHGTTRVIPTEAGVYATETSISGESETLLFVYTPCDLTGDIQVGEWSVPAQRFGYWLTNQVREVE